MSKLLVTGGLGVIGSYFVERMLKDGHTVDIIDPAEEPRNRWLADQLYLLAPDRVTVWNSRVERMEPSRLMALVVGAERVLHAGASTGIPYSVTAPGDDWERNVEGTRALLDALKEAPRPTVVLSSVKPYRVPVGRGLVESDELHCDEPYAASKAAGSLLAQAYGRSYGLPVSIFRCSNLAGPGPSHGPRHGWLTWFCISAAIGRPIRIEGSGEQTRDILHAHDVTSAVLAAMEIKQNGEIYNLGGGYANRISVKQCANMLQELTGVPIVSAPARAMDDRDVWADHSKFTAATGWTPRVNVLDTVKGILSWAQRWREELRLLYEGV